MPTLHAALPPELERRLRDEVRLNLPSPLHRIEDPILDRAGVRLFLKRDDLIHEELGGNKWRKLKYNLVEADRLGMDTLLTFGGAHSNHLYATAAAGHYFGFDTIGVVRGEPRETPVLRYAASRGMRLHHVDRSRYRAKDSEAHLADLRRRFGDFYLLPEGGSNQAALRGCAEVIAELPDTHDVVCCPCGTGGTLAGLVAGLEGRAHALGFAVLKGAGFLNRDVRSLLTTAGAQANANWSIDLEHHFGGFAKQPSALTEFCLAFERRHGVALDRVYTGKMMSGIFDLARRGRIGAPCEVVAIHTGGLQSATRATRLSLSAARRADRARTRC